MTRTPLRRVPGFRGRATPPAVQRPQAVAAIGRVVLRWQGEKHGYVCLCGYDDRGVPKAAGFRWDRDAKIWFTLDESRASRLYRYADPETQERLRPFLLDATALVASRAVDADIEIPLPPGLSLMPFQKAGVAYALDRKATLVGHEMGLGKTVIAIGVVNTDPDPYPVLVVCPASLKINWRRELEKWLVKPCLPMLAGDWFPISADAVIINYERLAKHAKAIASRQWKTLIVDEAHKVKSEKTIRTREVMAIKAERALFLTGTPIVNRPAELFPLVHYLAPAAFPDRQRFYDRYAKAKPWTPVGRAALAELNDRLRATCMVRVLKKDVLTELPPKVRQVIEFSSATAVAQVAKEKAAMAERAEVLTALKLAVELAKASDDPADYVVAVEKLKAGVSVSLAEMSKLRHDTALAKVPDVIDHVREAMESGSKLCLFAHHHDVIKAYHQAFGAKAVVLTGEMEMRERDASVQRFMKDDSCQLFIGSILAAGVGLTLTAASHVVFAELDWTPAGMTQAEDRCHRIGQKDSVLVQHLVLEESLDATMAKMLIEKQAVIDAALDNERGELAESPIVPGLEEPATGTVTKDRIAREAEGLGPEEVAAVHAALRAVAVMEGANRLDVAIARALAGERALTRKQAALGARVVRKYEVKE